MVVLGIELDVIIIGLLVGAGLVDNLAYIISFILLVV